MNPETVQELYDRVFNLDDDILFRWLLCAFGENGQHYWGAVIHVARAGEDGQLILQAAPITFYRADKLCGVEVYDELGRFVFRGYREYAHPVVNGDVLNLSHLFMR